jgi:hypothetical protein
MKWQSFISVNFQGENTVTLWVRHAEVKPHHGFLVGWKVNWIITVAGFCPECPVNVGHAP